MALEHQIAALIAAASLALGPAFAAERNQHDHGHAPGKLQLDNGKKWPTDEPLRQGMANIRAAMAPALPAIHKGKLAPAQYAALAGKIEAEMGSIVSNCKLEPAADAQLHLVLAEMVEGVEQMQGKNPKAKPRAGAEKVVHALDAYGRHFDHPDWTAQRH